MIYQGTTVAKLVRARNAATTSIAEFIRCSSRYVGETIWVFEGKDVKYYAPRIELFSGTRPRAVISAGGKSNVLKLFDFVDGNPDFSNVRCAFCVDRDFDMVHPAHPDVYVTPGYSIENLYATRAVMEKVLQGQFDLNCHRSEAVIQRVVKMYAGWQSKFLNGILAFNAWVAIQKKDPGYKLNLNDIGIEKIVSLTWNGRGLTVKKLLNLTNIRKIYPGYPRVSKTQLEKEILERFSGELVEQVRGKYAAEFLYTVLAKLISDARKSTPIFFDRKRTVTLSLSKVNLLSDLCAYADTPQCLRDFIQSHT